MAQNLTFFPLWWNRIVLKFVWRLTIYLGINDLGGDMLRLTFLLCSGLFLAMLLGGRDYGQLRPGLQRAEAEAKATMVPAVVPAVETVALASDVFVETPFVRAPVVQAPVIVAQGVVPKAPVVVAQPVALDPAPVELPAENTVFTLATFADVAREPEASGDGEIWYVSGNSLNVRSGPSTDDAVVGKLARGEAMLLIAREGDDWARIKIEGDGLEGYVATRFLTPNVPVVN